MQSSSKDREATVVVIDDDASVREALQGLFRSVGLAVKSYGSAQEYLASGQPDRPGCMVLDVRLPGQSGLELQEQLSRSGTSLPIILISAHADVPMSVRGMKAGAVEFLTKPVRDQDLLDAVQEAVGQDLAQQEAARAIEALEARFRTLTPREREVMALVVTGSRNKQIAAAMAVSEATIKLHRGQVMRKLGAQSVAELVEMARALKLGRQSQQ